MKKRGRLKLHFGDGVGSLRRMRRDRALNLVNWLLGLDEIDRAFTTGEVCRRIGFLGMRRLQNRGLLFRPAPGQLQVHELALMRLVCRVPA